MQHFLLLEEMEETGGIKKVKECEKSEDCGVWMNSAVADWNFTQIKGDQDPTLNKLTFSVTPGELIVVVGMYIFQNYNKNVS